MIRSMTGFASAEGAQGAFSWTWELRAVNGRGLDLRLRIPEWIDGLELALRKRLTEAVGRGSVTLTLKVTRVSGSANTQINKKALSGMLEALGQVEAEALARGQTLAPATAADVLNLRGVLESADATADPDLVAGLRATLLTSFDKVLTAFNAMRGGEGDALAPVLTRHLDEIAALAEAARDAASARQEPARAAFAAALTRILEQAPEIGEDRVAQELALLAVKADVTEEINRLDAHVAAARALLENGGTIGRKVDFLMQEFNREANTLCSKSGNAPLTAIGLELKTKIDQLREQVQNVE